MSTLALLLLRPAAACDRVDVDAPGVSIHVDECGGDPAPSAVLVGPDGDGDEERMEAIEEDDEFHDLPDHGQRLVAQYGLQFLPTTPGHQASLRLVGEHDGYVGGELRYTPGSDFVGVGRAGAGFDLAGGGPFDFTLGLWVGGAGQWERSAEAARLWGSPILGTEVGLGLEGHRLFAKYRWLGGIGGGPMDELLTENELTFGYKVTKAVHLTGQYLVLSPGHLDNQSGVGLGLRVAL